jgi:peroxiredoxin
MARANDFALNFGIDQQLATLSPDSAWNPDIESGLAILRSRQSLKKRMVTRWMAAGAAVAAMGVFLAAFPQPRVLAHRCIDCSVALWQGLSTAPPAASDALIPAAKREAAPDFRLSDAVGNPVALSNLKGKVVLLNFWATWCGGCQVEIPWFMEFQNKYWSAGLAVVGISTDDDGWKSVRPYLKEKKLNYTIAIDDGTAGKLYKLDSMPMTILIDRDGKVAASHVGLVSKNSYQAEIESLLKK